MKLLRENLQLGDADNSEVVQILLRAPQILSMSAEISLQPTLRWLEGRLRIPFVHAVEITRNNPTLLFLCVEKNLEPKLVWIKSNLNLDDDAAREMFLAVPRLLGSSLAENLKVTLPWLPEALGLDAGQAVALMKRAPILMVCSIADNLDPTLLSFFRDEMRALKQELRGAVLSNPQVLTYSLNGRLRPRVAKMHLVKIRSEFSKHRYWVTCWSNPNFEMFSESCGRRC